MRLRPYLFLAATLTACASGAATSPRSFSIPEYRLGSYSFTERVPTTRGQTVPLDGDFIVTTDSVVVSTALSACQYELTTTRGGPIVYNCGDVTFAFDRVDPVNRAMYRMRVRYLETQTVCAQYATDNTGQSRCVSFRTESTEQTAVRSGRLNARRNGN